METPENNGPLSFIQSTTAKMILIGLLTLVLFIPLALVSELITERAQRQKEVITETNSKWGDSIYFYGPILKVPYKVYAETVSENEKTKEVVKQKTVSTEFAYFFPQQLKTNSGITTSVLKRSNYESVVFSSQMKFAGEFIRPDFSPVQIPNESIDWNKATILIQTSNLKSIKDEVKINLRGTNYTFEPIYNTDKTSKIEALETGYLDARDIMNASNEFSFTISYNGSEKTYKWWKYL